MKDAQLIRDKISISNYLGRFINLRHKGGGEYLGLCPFHGEKTPSFTVSDPKGFYHCFGCGAHGDIITFVCQKDNLEYKQALEVLAREAGITLSRTEPRENEDKKLYHAIYDYFSQYYRSCLMKEVKVIQYLEKRGINRATIEKRNLGYVPNTLPKELTDKFGIDALLKAGILAAREYEPEGRHRVGEPHHTTVSEKSGGGSKIYNPFAGRIVIPIYDRYGHKVVAFGARALLDGKHPKYINTGNTSYFHKGYNVYGVESIPRTIQQLLIVEGYFDVLTLGQAAITAIAPLGTALRTEQLAIAWKFHKEPIICFDNDIAGRKAMYKAAINALPDVNPQKSIRFLLLQGGKDPDEVLRERGKAYLVEQMERNALSLAEFIFLEERQSIITDKEQKGTPEQRAALREKLLGLADSIMHKSTALEYRRYFQDKCYKLFSSERMQSRFTRSEGRTLDASLQTRWHDDALSVQGKVIRQQSDITSPILAAFCVLIDKPHLIDYPEVRAKLKSFQCSDKRLEEIREIMLSSPHALVNDRDALEQLRIRISKISALPSTVPTEEAEALAFVFRGLTLYQLELITEKVATLTRSMIDSEAKDLERVQQELVSLKKQEKQLKNSLCV